MIIFNPNMKQFFTICICSAVSLTALAFLGPKTAQAEYYDNPYGFKIETPLYEFEAPYFTDQRNVTVTVRDGMALQLDDDTRMSLSGIARPPYEQRSNISDNLATAGEGSRGASVGLSLSYTLD